MKRHLAISFFLFAAARLIAQTAGEPTSFGDWAVSTNISLSGLKLAARLVVSEATNNYSSRGAIAYVELQNTNDDAAVLFVYDYGLGTLDCKVSDSSGKAIPSLTGGTYNGPFPEPCWLALPDDSLVRFAPMSGSIVTTNGELGIHAGDDYWVIRRGDTNDYYLSGTLNLNVPESEKPPAWYIKTSTHTITNEVSDDVWRGTIKLPPVKIPANIP